MAALACPCIGLAKGAGKSDVTATQEETLIAYGVGLLIVGLIAGAVGGTLVYFIDKALSRYQERHRHPA
jgi:hypothetical protein